MMKRPTHFLLGITIMFAQTWGKKLNYYRVLNPRLILATLISLIPGRHQLHRINPIYKTSIPA